MLTLIAFIVAILILVSLHEFGHYIVARWCGIKVTRFSIGFGTPFFKRIYRGTEWCLAPIPLGGYIKMVDTREGKVEDADLPYAFDKQHPAKRLAVVAAGPIMNLILAVILYGLSFSMGVTETRPYVGMVENGSVAERSGFRAGDFIRSVNNVPTTNWADVQAEIVLNLDAGKVVVDVNNAQGLPETRTINVAGTDETADIIRHQSGNIGLWPFRLTTTLAVVAPESPAERAGLKVGDVLLSANGQTITDWQQWVNLVRNSPGEKINLSYRRNQKVFTTALRPDSVELPDGSLVGKAGVAAKADKAWNEKIQYHYQPTLSEAFKMGWDKTIGYAKLTLEFFGKLITGKASSAHISGPLTIADVAGKSAEMGLQSYLAFLALLSVSLGVLNLLPIPVLDGGHLVYYTVEWIRGKPLSERVQMIGVRLGLLAMLALMLLAFFNDITRLFG